MESWCLVERGDTFYPPHLKKAPRRGKKKKKFKPTTLYA
jgi:hypothetical protein